MTIHRITIEVDIPEKYSGFRQAYWHGAAERLLRRVPFLNEKDQKALYAGMASNSARYVPAKEKCDE